MAIRKIIEIDEEKCTGCGNCIIDCAEGALEIIDGKAKVIKDSFCDGLGACLGSCPEGALRIIEREAEDFNEEEVEAFLKAKKENPAENMACGCPGSMLRTFIPKPAHGSCNCEGTEVETAEVKSELGQWPIQLRLLPSSGSLYENKDLMLIADCVGVAFPKLHSKLVKGNTIVLTCPKLDNAEESVTKLSEIFASSVKSISVAIMEVPCCSGLVNIAKEALSRSGVNHKLNIIKIAIKGEELERFEA